MIHHVHSVAIQQTAQRLKQQQSEIQDCSTDMYRADVCLKKLAIYNAHPSCFLLVATVASESFNRLHQQQLLQAWSSPAWQTLAAWQHLPGCSAVLEMLLRNGQSTNAENVSNVVQTVMTNLVTQVTRPPTTASCRAQISLLASLHKVMLLHSFSTADTVPGCSTSRSDPDRGQTMHLIHVHLQNALTAVLAHTQTECAVGIATSEGVISQQDADAANTLAGSIPRTDASVSCCGDMRSASAAPHHPCMEGTHQLLSILVMYVVWSGNLCTRMAKRQQRRGPPIMAKGASDSAKKKGAASAHDAVLAGNPREAEESAEGGLGWIVEVEAHDAELASVARLLVLPSQPADWKTRSEASRQETAVWDEFALRHFHGRLLPGCSYQGCTNLYGISEGALETLLCSGCRRLRYCSVECRKAAWVKGGHSEVCGRGRWAASAAEAPRWYCRVELGRDGLVKS